MRVCFTTVPNLRLETHLTSSIQSRVGGSVVLGIIGVVIVILDVDGIVGVVFEQVHLVRVGV